MSKCYQWKNIRKLNKSLHVQLEETRKELQIFHTLMKCWSFTGYNPIGQYWNVAFAIKDEKLANDLNTIAINVIKEVKND